MSNTINWMFDGRVGENSNVFRGRVGGPLHVMFGRGRGERAIKCREMYN